MRAEEATKDIGTFAKDEEKPETEDATIQVKEEAFDQSVAVGTEEAFKVVEETGEKVLKEQIAKDDAESITQVEIQRDSLKNDTIQVKPEDVKKESILEDETKAAKKDELLTRKKEESH